ncbi:MAG: hypothetical protein ABH871_05695 [Pseudomonadota bacterium]
MKSTIMSLMFVMMMFLFPGLASADQAQVPNVIGYHSVIFDEGGNPIADGEVNVWFRIIDAAGAVLYEETQSVTAVGGQVSALIGNGLTSDSAPTGGVPIDALNPFGRYLEVEVEGKSPLPAMELASVPYASFAQVALGAGEGAIDGNAIKDKSISFDDLSDDIIDKMAQKLGGAGANSIVLKENLDTLYRSPSAAASIGVSRGLSFSGANDLQGVLRDLDRAIARREEKIETTDAALTAEVSARASAIAQEASARANADATKVSKSGDTMDGTLHMNANITLAGGFTVDGVDIGNLQASVSAIENPQLLSFTRSIWGTVSPGQGVAEFHGENASATLIQPGKYRITFTQALSDEYYAAVVTPTNDAKAADASTAAPLIISDKTADGFTVNVLGMTLQSFDFIVMGH